MPAGSESTRRKASIPGPQLGDRLHRAGLMQNSRAQGAEDLIVDRLRVGTRTLLAAGHAVDVEAVIVGAGLQFHQDRRRFAGVVAWMAEQMAPQFAADRPE